jgi:tetratricopeptide (TPR) repeat protein
LQAMGDNFGHAVGTTYASLAYEQNGQIEDALAGFEQAAEALDKIGTPGNLQDARAGAARCLLKLNMLERALQAALLLWDYLRQQAAVGMEFPILAHETCAEIFSLTGEPVLAKRAVQAGYGELLLRAGRISLPEWRQSFLERVPEHQRIHTRWKKYVEMDQM